MVLYDNGTGSGAACREAVESVRQLVAAGEGLRKVVIEAPLLLVDPEGAASGGPVAFRTLLAALIGEFGFVLTSAAWLESEVCQDETLCRRYLVALHRPNEHARGQPKTNVAETETKVSH